MKDFFDRLTAFYNDPEHRNRRFFITTVIGFVAGGLLAYLLADIASKREQARHTFFRVVEITDDTYDPAIWGKNFPMQYEDYLKTADMRRTRYGGSEAMPHTPTDADPRSVVAQSKLQDDPRLVTMWAGYAFSKDFREERGHAYMLEDQLYTERQKVGQPGTCVNCHASTYAAMKKLGNGNIIDGFHKINAMKYAEVKEHVSHPVACIDCHNAADMSLRVTRPALMEGLKALKASQGIKNYDVNRDATRQEMRTYVCAQCHVEYYFKGQEKTLTFPWSEGLKADQILAYYDKVGFKDWTHKETGAPTLKAQHPEFEMFSQGIHARSGVTCADCHMPYRREGNAKISDHHVRSPYLNVQAACGTCHSLPEDQLRKRIDVIQDTHWQLRNVAFDALIDLIQDIKKAREQGASDAALSQARDFQRKAQFLFDFVEAENSTGFHAPQESARILGLSIDYSRKGQKAIPR